MTTASGAADRAGSHGPAQARTLHRLRPDPLARLVSITIGRARRLPAHALRDFSARETEEAAA